MEKIEKLEGHMVDSGYLGSGIEPATRWQLMEKINEIIDYLNQEELSKIGHRYPQKAVYISAEEVERREQLSKLKE